MKEPLLPCSRLIINVVGPITQRALARQCSTPPARTLIHRTGASTTDGFIWLPRTTNRSVMDRQMAGSCRHSISTPDMDQPSESTQLIVLLSDVKVGTAGVHCSAFFYHRSLTWDWWLRHMRNILPN